MVQNYFSCVLEILRNFSRILESTKRIAKSCEAFWSANLLEISTVSEHTFSRIFEKELKQWFLLDDEEKWKELESAFEDFNLTRFQAENLNKVRFNFTILKQACHRKKVPLFSGCTDALNDCYLFFSCWLVYLSWGVSALFLTRMKMDLSVLKFKNKVKFSKCFGYTKIQ